MKNIVLFLTLSLLCINVSAQQFVVDGEIFKVNENNGYGFKGDKNVEVIYRKDTIRIMYLTFDNNPFIVQKIYFVGQDHSEFFISGIGKEFFQTSKNGHPYYDLRDVDMTLHYIKEDGEWIIKK